MDEILIAMARVGRPMSAPALAREAGLEKPPQRFALLRLVHYGLIRRLKNYRYELDARYPVADELRALLVCLGCGNPSAISGSVPKRAPTAADIDGLGRLFGGIETTQVLLRLGLGPMQQTALLEVADHDLKMAIKVLHRMGVIERRHDRSNYIMWRLDRAFYAHRQLVALLNRMRAVLEQGTDAMV